MDEENKVNPIHEFEYIKKNEQFNRAIDERKIINENPKIKDVNKSHQVKSKKVANVVKQAFFVAIAGGTVLGANIFGIAPNGLEIDRLFAMAGANEIFYEISLLSEDEYCENVVVELYNDFTNRTHAMEYTFDEYVFEDLQTNMYYTLSVKHKNKVIFKVNLKTSTNGRKEPYIYKRQKSIEADGYFDDTYYDDYSSSKNSYNNDQMTGDNDLLLDDDNSSKDEEEISGQTNNNTFDPTGRG